MTQFVDGRRKFLRGNGDTQAKRLRLAIDKQHPWSQSRLADWIKAHPIPDSDIRTYSAIRAIERGARPGNAEQLENYLKKLIQSREK